MKIAQFSYGKRNAGTIKNSLVFLQKTHSRADPADHLKQLKIAQFPKQFKLFGIAYKQLIKISYKIAYVPTPLRPGFSLKQLSFPKGNASLGVCAAPLEIAQFSQAECMTARLRSGTQKQLSFHNRNSTLPACPPKQLSFDRQNAWLANALTIT